MSKINKDFCIQIPHQFWDIKKKLNTGEYFHEYLFLYSYILTEKGLSRSNKDYSITRTSITMIHNDIKFAKSSKHPEVNKNKIRSMLLRLYEFGHIHLSNENMTYNDLFSIRIKNMSEEESHKYANINGHIYEICVDGGYKYLDVHSERFSILCVVKRLEGQRNTISYQEFAEMIDRSYPHTVKIVNEAVTSGYLLQVSKGGYYENCYQINYDEPIPIKHTSNKTRKRKTNQPEKELEDFLVPKLHVVEDGLKYVDRQVKVDNGIIDILARDKNNTLCIIELKAVSDNKDFVFQASYYPTQFDEDCRVITIAPDYSKKIALALHRLNYVEMKTYKYIDNNLLVVQDFGMKAALI